MDPPRASDPDDTLAQPTRGRLFAVLGELRRAAGTEELAGLIGRHPNGVRVHLERLEDAGLVVRSPVRQPRGRPRDAWTIAADARPGGSAPRAYADLGRWLARAVPRGSTELPDIEEVGREIGHELAPRDARANEPAMHTALTALGFQPVEEPGGDGRRTYCLRNCPYQDAVHENPDLICGLHRGLTRGLLDVLEPSAELTDFVARDPDTAGCRVEVTTPDGAGGA